MHYRISSSDSSHSHKTWAEHSAQDFYGHSSPSPPTPNAPHIHTVSLPVSITNAPHLHTVLLPHPYAASHQSPVSYQHSSTSHPSLMVLHPLLSRGPNLMFNVTRDLAYVQLRPDCLPTMLQEPAVHPPVFHMTIAIFELHTWSIEVMNPRCITVHDVLLRIREQLNRSAAAHEMRNPSHAVAMDSFRARCRADPREHAQGVKRVDFLGPKVFFNGLTRARDGSDSWDLHFSHGV
ncbi:hypothetical protein K503DRAFT_859221 [Rhizopogon vinicolor AM-OR11-026]|uniref:DUF6699 domain-containing protein n=1 Tax=Rhizopogon vinicolor AM-OR11-026 TaxID=1314800 RepID=A0A1B7MP90_9AGAM|nr:hypothetical protein K503DRAFT_859221 [Rhizopogon vinicolor AM-OR11-026]